MPHGEEFSNTLLVEVNGRPLPADVAALLAGGYVDDSSNVPDLFLLRFTDARGTVIEKGGFKIGHPIRLLVQTSGAGGPQLLLTGEITALEAEVSENGQHTVVRGLDLSHRLFRGRRVEAYVNSTVGDIASKVAQRAGLTPGSINGSATVLPHVSQDGVTDWEFLSRLARQTGCLVNVVDGKLDFTAATRAAQAPGGTAGARDNPHVVERGVNLVSLRASVTSSDQVPDVEVRGWSVKAKKALVAKATAETTTVQLSGVTPAGLAKEAKAPTYLAPWPGYDQQALCSATAKALAGHLAGGFAGLEGVVRGNPKLRSGEAVSLVGVGKPFEGRYTLSGTRHEFSPELGYLTAFTVSNDSERSLYGLATGASGAAQPPLSGVVSALVSDLKDPDKLGRIKVTFPVLSDQYVSGWARVLQLGAGNTRGTAWLPEVGDEVLVAFGQNSFQQPYVLGGLYNGKDKPDKTWEEHIDSTDGKVKRRAFVSRQGMVLEFLEAPDGEKLNVRSKDGKQQLSLVQKPDAAVSLVSDGPIDIKAGKDVTITTATGNVKISGQKVSIEATSDLELKGVNVKATATAAAEVKGVTAKVTADATAELSGSATTTIRGGIVRIN